MHRCKRPVQASWTPARIQPQWAAEPCGHHVLATSVQHALYAACLTHTAWACHFSSHFCLVHAGQTAVATTFAASTSATCAGPFREGFTITGYDTKTSKPMIHGLSGLPMAYSFFFAVKWPFIQFVICFIFLGHYITNSTLYPTLEDKVSACCASCAAAPQCDAWTLKESDGYCYMYYLWADDSKSVSNFNGNCLPRVSTTFATNQYYTYFESASAAACCGVRTHARMHACTHAPMHTHGGAGVYC